VGFDVALFAGVSSGPLRRRRQDVLRNACQPGPFSLSPRKNVDTGEPSSQLSGGPCRFADFLNTRPPFIPCLWLFESGKTDQASGRLITISEWQAQKISIQFEWDEEKASRNEKKHGVTFEEARTIFNDPLPSQLLTRPILQKKIAGWTREGLRR
jgi:hypothetical protein